MKCTAAILLLLLPFTKIPEIIAQNLSYNYRLKCVTNYCQTHDIKKLMEFPISTFDTFLFYAQFCL